MDCKGRRLKIQNMTYEKTYTCSLCGGEGVAEYFDFVKEEYGKDVCPDCNGLGITLTNNKTLKDKIETTKILSN
jgi:DnaJ-class molecular chaperone